VIAGKKGMIFSLIGILVAVLIAVFLFSKAANVYFKKGPEPGQGVANVFSENDAPLSVVTPSDAQGVLASMKSQINAATEKELSRAQDLQSTK
jgi:hypothetical protein